MTQIFLFPPVSTLIEVLEAMASNDIQSSQAPEFPEFAIETVRLRSFADWPKMMKQRPEQMADAGFFYTQLSDRVICFSCGGGLCEWDENDCPWEQHAFWFDHCNYVRLLKGPEYIAEIERKFSMEENGENNNSDTPLSSQENHERNGDNNCSGNHSNSKHPLNDKNQKENVKLNDSRLCKICYVNEYNTVFLPCGHILACAKCAASQTKCPLCRKQFESINRIYLP